MWQLSAMPLRSGPLITDARATRFDVVLCKHDRARVLCGVARGTGRAEQSSDEYALMRSDPRAESASLVPQATSNSR
jgi:hypothetical protein